MQKSAKISKKFVYYNEELVTNSKFQTQLSRKLQRFRICRKNKKCSIFHDLSEYIIVYMIVNYWTGPLNDQKLPFFIKNDQKLTLPSTLFEMSVSKKSVESYLSK